MSGAARCGAPGRECYEWHWLPRLRDAVRKGAGDGYGHRSVAPCHADRERSLSTGIGDDGLPVYWCFACQDHLRTRGALLAAGIAPGCVRLPRSGRAELQDRVAVLLETDMHHAEKILRLAALTFSGGRLPHGAELDALARRVGVSRRTAFAILASEVKGADQVPTPAKDGTSNGHVRRIA